MKKITSILMAMVGWLFAVNASAQSYTLSSTPTEGTNLKNGYYVIQTKCKGDTGYMYHESGQSNRPFRQWLETGLDLTTLQTKFFWKLTKNDTDGTFTLQNVASGAYIPTEAQGNNMQASTAESNAAQLKCDTENTYSFDLSGGVVLYESNQTKVNGNNLNIHVNTPNESATTGYKHNFSYWNGGQVSSTGSLVQFAFYEVSYNAIYNVIADGTTVQTITVKDVELGSTASVPSSSVEASCYYTPTLTSATTGVGDLTVSAGNTTFNVQYVAGKTLETTPTAATDLTDGTYVLKVATGDLTTTGYLNHVSSCSANRNFHLTSGDVDLANNNYLWKLVKKDAGFTLQNVGTGAYVPADAATNKNMQTATTEDNAAVLVADPIDGGKLTNGIALYDANNQADGTNLYIYKNGHSDGSTYANGSYWTNKNVNGAMVQFAFYKVNETTMPFDTTKVYTIKLNNSDSNYASHADASAENISTDKSMDTWANYKGGLWQIKKSGLGVKLYDYADKKYVTVSSPETGTAATLDNNGTTFIMKTNSNGGYSLQYPGATTAHLGNHTNSCLSISNSDDSQNSAASNFTLTEYSLETAKSLLTTDLNGTTTGESYDKDNYLQCTTNSETIATATTAVTSAESIDDLFSITVGKSFAPETNAYYQIIGKPVVESTATHNNYALTTQNMSVSKDGILDQEFEDTNNRRIERRTLADKTLVPQLWKFVKGSNGGYKIKNANTGCFIGQMTADDTAIEMPVAEAGAGEFSLSGSDKYAVLTEVDSRGNGKIIGALNGDTETDVNIGNDADATDDNTYWAIKKVTVVPVTISSVGYASLALPFAVTLPEDGSVKAYIGQSIGEGYMTLTEISGNVIPANTGVIIAGSGTVNLTISEGSTNDVSGNLLHGATAQRGGFEADATYVLARNNTTGAATFKQSLLTEVPANKAYLLTTEISATSGGSNVLSFRFGKATGIDSAKAEADGADATFYDLNGRRVLYPAHGVFVKANGQKVYIK